MGNIVSGSAIDPLTGNPCLWAYCIGGNVSDDGDVLFDSKGGNWVTGPAALPPYHCYYWLFNEPLGAIDYVLCRDPSPVGSFVEVTWWEVLDPFDPTDGLPVPVNFANPTAEGFCCSPSDLWGGHPLYDPGARPPPSGRNVYGIRCSIEGPIDNGSGIVPDIAGALGPPPTP